MNLIILLFALFSYSECMKLSKNSLDSIRNILSMYGSITEPESLLTDLDGLGRAFSHVNEEGSKILAETLIQAHDGRELDSEEIETLAKEAVRVGNFNAYQCFSQDFVLTNLDVFIIAASNGHVGILDHENKMSPQIVSSVRSEMHELLPDIIRAGHLNVLRWYFENYLLFFADARKILLEAIEVRNEVNNEELINLLLNEQKYFYYHIDNNVEWLTYEECIRMDTDFQNELVLFKGAEFGSMTVVDFFFSRQLFNSPENLDKVRDLAGRNGHTEISDLIHTYSMM